MAKGDIYILKNGKTVIAEDVGKAKICIGEKRNRLTICDRGPTTKSKKARVICQCECGNYTLINHQDFKEGRVQSCGCLSVEKKIERCKQTAIDYSSTERNINPFYKYIQPTSMRKNHGEIVWEIECRRCGKHYFDAPNELISEKRTHGNNPCQCQQKYSIGVQKIIALLAENNISYILEKTFPSCVSNKGYLLPFDFYLPDYHILIEYDGEQHFKLAFGQDENKLIAQQENDLLKDIWCKNNNITLIRIPYYQKQIKLTDLIKENNNIG